MLETYPMLRGYGEANKSITEIEFAHGALYPSVPGSAFIYEQVTPSQKIDPADRVSMDELKDTIRTSDLPFRSFDTPEELGDKVYNDLLFLLERDWPISAEPTPLESERTAHRAFAFNRTRAYVATPEYTERFERFVSEDSTPLILWGRSGLGKSALMAHLASEYERQHPDAFVVLHFVGASAGASSAADVMRRIAAEIKLRYDLPDEVQNDDATLAQEFPSWLANIRADDKLILLVDAVNQLSGIGREMHWLPEFIPSNVRLVISTTPDTPLEELRKRDWQELEIQPMGESARVQIATDYLASFGKKLTREQIERVASEPKLESPLFLRTILEELRVFGVYESLEEHLATYLSSEDEHELFHHVLARMERDFGSDAVHSVMTALWASRFGLTETELLEITQLPRYALSEFLIALEFHLMQRNGLYTFFHNYLRQAVEERYLTDNEKIKTAHRHLAHYFADSPYNSRRRDEEPWQWEHAESWDNYRKCLTDVEFIAPLLVDERRHELLAFWRVYQEHFDISSTYRKVIDDYQRTCTDEHKLAELLCTLGSSLVSASQYDEAGKMLRTALELGEKIYEERDLYQAEAADQLATCYYYQGKYAEAEQFYRKAIHIRETVLGANDPLTAKSLNNLGIIYYSLGKYSESREMYESAIESYRNHFANKDHSEIASILNNLGAVQHAERNYEAAIHSFRASISMYERLYGKRYPGKLSPLGNMSMSLREQKRIIESEKICLEAIELSRATYGNNHRDLATRLSNLALLYSKFMNRYAEALQAYEEAIKIRELILGKMHIDTITSYLNIALAEIRAGNKRKGEKLFKKYLPVEEQILGKNHDRVITHKEIFEELQR